ncbi:MAG: helix-turn-helix domain-containing protein [Candidatus Limnocylindrales bacterium]
MSSYKRIKRAGLETRAGRRRARMVAARLGTAVREARLSAGLTQVQVADRSGLSQPFLSQLERGDGESSSIETWAVVAAAVGEQLVSFLEHAPGAGLPRDIEHLRRQSALIRLAAPGAWAGLPELAVNPERRWSRSIDVALVRNSTAEAVVAEIWNWFEDVGEALRGLDEKVAVVRNRLDPRVEWTVRALFVVRDTRRNRALINELRPLFLARFQADSGPWLRALTDPDCRLPDGDGLLWSDRTGTRLRASRLRASSTARAR